MCSLNFCNSKQDKQEFHKNLPVLLVSVVVLTVLLKSVFFPKNLGNGHCSPNSSYTVYTKQRMYKIENLQESRHGKQNSQIIVKGKDKLQE